MNRFADFDPRDLDPATGRPVAGYSSPSLDDSFHAGEMDVDDRPRKPKRKTAGDVRAEAVRIARLHADERDKEGDPEGAGVMRDLASAIARIRVQP